MPWRLTFFTVMTYGVKVYANFSRPILRVYNRKDKKEYTHTIKSDIKYIN